MHKMVSMHLLAAEIILTMVTVNSRAGRLHTFAGHVQDRLCHREFSLCVDAIGKGSKSQGSIEKAAHCKCRKRKRRRSVALGGQW